MNDMAMKQSDIASEVRGAKLDILSAGVETLPGVGENRRALLERLGIATIEDLISHFPVGYEDRSAIAQIANAPEGARVTVEAEIIQARNVHLRGRMNMARLRLRDSSGECAATFFGRGFLVGSAFKIGARAYFSGEFEYYKDELTLKNPDYEMIQEDTQEKLHTGRIVPNYRLTDKLTQRMLRQWVHTALAILPEVLPETLPTDILTKHGFPGRYQTLQTMHFPSSLEEAHHARRRQAYEEFFNVQLRIMGERARRVGVENGVLHKINGDILKSLGKSLPFELTQGQDKAISEILGDMQSPMPMARLLQGDVGCGKTIVAVHAIAAACDGAYQSALMAPTEILAEQHWRSLHNILSPFGVHVTQLTSSSTGQKKLRNEIALGNWDVVVGTHALIQDSTLFHNLGLVIIDEQHRFGVIQRDSLRLKGAMPDLLQMTATPIPRSLAMTLYGALDLSVIDELPPGRKTIKTQRIPDSKVLDMYGFINEQVSNGFQAYIVCPLVEESDKKALKAVTAHFEEISAGPLAGVRSEIVHGRLSGECKEEIMERFRTGQIDVLFSTTVIEVGLDSPKATIMVIEDAGQFGLTQLHQLRGRVGRSNEQSYCFLMGKAKTKEGNARLKILCECASGFEIAEEDFKLRGVGEFYGVKQAGLSDFRVADLVRDIRLLSIAQDDAKEMVARGDSFLYTGCINNPKEIFLH